MRQRKEVDFEDGTQVGGGEEGGDIMPGVKVDTYGGWR